MKYSITESIKDSLKGNMILHCRNIISVYKINTYQNTFNENKQMRTHTDIILYFF